MCLNVHPFPFLFSTLLFQSFSLPLFYIISFYRTATCLARKYFTNTLFVCMLDLSAFIEYSNVKLFFLSSLLPSHPANRLQPLTGIVFNQNNRWVFINCKCPFCCNGTRHTCRQRGREKKSSEQVRNRKRQSNELSLILLRLQGRKKAEFVWTRIATAVCVNDNDVYQLTV